MADSTPAVHLGLCLWFGAVPARPRANGKAQRADCARAGKSCGEKSTHLPHAAEQAAEPITAEHVARGDRKTSEGLASALQ